MNRRNFLSSGCAAAALTGIPPAAAAPPTGPLMRLGCQSAPTNEQHLQYLERYGVQGICGYPENADGRLYATPDELHRMRDLAERHHITLDIIAPPFLASSHIDREKHPAIMLAQSPQRDRDIEDLQTLIRNCSATGIPAIKYNLSVLGVLSVVGNLVRHRAAPETDFETSAAQVVEHADFLQYPQRVMQRQRIDECAETQPLGALRDRREEHAR